MTGSFKSWGPRRSGTNVFHRVLTGSTDLVDDVPGWKHGVPTPVPEADVHLIHTKHPYAWLLSMERWWAAWEPLDRALTRLHVRWDARDAVMRHHASRLDAYAGRLHSWFAVLPPDRTVLVRYEDVLEDVERVVEVAGGEITATPSLPGERVDSTGETGSSGFDPTYYTERVWAERFHLAELEELSIYLDETGYRRDFEERLGYRMNL